MNHTQATWAMAGLIAAAAALFAAGLVVARRLPAARVKKGTCEGCRQWGPSELRDVRDKQGRVGFCGIHRSRTLFSDDCPQHEGIELGWWDAFVPFVAVYGCCWGVGLVARVVAGVLAW